MQPKFSKGDTVRLTTGYAEPWVIDSVQDVPDARDNSKRVYVYGGATEKAYPPASIAAAYEEHLVLVDTEVTSEKSPEEVEEAAPETDPGLEVVQEYQGFEPAEDEEDGDILDELEEHAEVLDEAMAIGQDIVNTTKTLIKVISTNNQLLTYGFELLEKMSGKPKEEPAKTD